MARAEEDCKFYAAEVILGLQELHSLNIVYRCAFPATSMQPAYRLHAFAIAVI